MSLTRLDIKVFYNAVSLLANHISAEDAPLPSDLLDAAKWLKTNYITYLDAEEKESKTLDLQKQKLIVQINKAKDLFALEQTATILRGLSKEMAEWQPIFEKISSDLKQAHPMQIKLVFDQTADEDLFIYLADMQSSHMSFRENPTLVPTIIATGATLEEHRKTKFSVNIEDFNKHVELYNRGREIESIQPYFQKLYTQLSGMVHEDIQLHNIYRRTAFYLSAIYFRAAKDMLSKNNYKLAYTYLDQTAEVFGVYKKMFALSHGEYPAGDTNRKHHESFFVTTEISLQLLRKKISFSEAFDAINLQVETFCCFGDVPDEAVALNDVTNLCADITKLALSIPPLEQLDAGSEVKSPDTLTQKITTEVFYTHQLAHSKMFQLCFELADATCALAIDYYSNSTSLINVTKNCYMKAFEHADHVAEKSEEQIKFLYRSQLSVVTLYKLQAALTANNDSFAANNEYFAALDILNVVISPPTMKEELLIAFCSLVTDINKLLTTQINLLISRNAAPKEWWPISDKFDDLFTAIECFTKRHENFKIERGFQDCFKLSTDTFQALKNKILQAASKINVVGSHYNPMLFTPQPTEVNDEKRKASVPDEPNRTPISPTSK
ncbi:MAG: hypothetical protein ABI370_01160 [Gammaproteobacteria bacterium]